MTTQELPATIVSAKEKRLRLPYKIALLLSIEVWKHHANNAKLSSRAIIEEHQEDSVDRYGYPANDCWLCHYRAANELVCEKFCPLKHCGGGSQYRRWGIAKTALAAADYDDQSFATLSCNLAHHILNTMRDAYDTYPSTAAPEVVMIEDRRKSLAKYKEENEEEEVTNEEGKR